MQYENEKKDNEKKSEYGSANIGKKIEMILKFIHETWILQSIRHFFSLLMKCL